MSQSAAPAIKPAFSRLHLSDRSLSWQIGVEPAIVHGVLPFIVGGVLKSALAAAILGVLARRGAARRA